jgi:hypothetical protein
VSRILELLLVWVKQKSARPIAGRQLGLLPSVVGRFALVHAEVNLKRCDFRMIFVLSTTRPTLADVRFFGRMAAGAGTLT